MYRIGDFLIQIKNAYQAGKKQVSYPHSKAVDALSKILEKEGYIKKSKLKTQKSKSGAEIKSLEIELKYEGRVPALSDIKLVSKPSAHRYINRVHLAKLSRYGISILSTSSGMMTGKEAQKKGAGGELLCQIT